MVNQDKHHIEPENDDIHRLLSGLARVKAPNDFDFRVRARIAEGRPAKRGVSWFPSLVRVTAPLALLLAIAGYFGINSLKERETNTAHNVEVIDASPEPLPVFADGSPGQAQPPAAQSEVAVIETPEKQAARPVLRGVPKADPKIEKPGGGSYDKAIGVGANITKDVDDNEPEPAGRKLIISSREFLTNAGVSATYAGSGGRVTSVGGAAAGAGVLAGDVIEAVNVQGGTLRVRRDGRSITFKIK